MCAYVHTRTGLSVRARRTLFTRKDATTHNQANTKLHPCWVRNEYELEEHLAGHRSPILLSVGRGLASSPPPAGRREAGSTSGSRRGIRGGSSRTRSRGCAHHLMIRRRRASAPRRRRRLPSPPCCHLLGVVWVNNKTGKEKKRHQRHLDRV